MQPIELGCTYTDQITRFSGVAVGFVQYLTGCNQALLVPPVTEDGSIRSGEWFDVQRLVRSSADPVILDNGFNPGCDRQAPKI